MKKLFAITAIIICISSIQAQTVNNLFKPTIKAVAFPNGIKMLKNGKMLIAGNFQMIDSTFVNGIVRINEDGSLDKTFSFPYKVNGSIASIIEQGDGKIILGGQSIVSNLRDIIRINPDGTIDNSFNLASGIRCIVKLGIQSDGKYVVFSCNSGTIFRLNTDGSLDNTFLVVNGPDSYGIERTDMKIQSDDKIIIAGGFSTFNGISAGSIVRLNSNGSADTSFHAGTGLGGLNHAVTSIGIQSDGKIILAGQFDHYNGNSVINFVRLDKNGFFDGSFNVSSTSVVFPNLIDRIIVQNDNKIILSAIVTSFNDFYYRIIRTDQNGNLDNTFQQCDLLGWNEVGAVPSPKLELNSNNDLFIAGAFIDCNHVKRIGIASFSTAGTLNEFYIKTWGRPSINKAIMQPDGKIIIGGQFIEINNTSVNNIARLNPDGSLDTAFVNKIGVGPDRSVYTLALQDDGKILVGGAFSQFNNSSNRSQIVRLERVGSLDTSFHAIIPLVQLGPGMNVIKLQKDGKIIIGGLFNYINSNNINNLARLNPNGSLDATFNTGNVLGSNDQIYSLDFQSDSSIIAGGLNNSSYTGVLLKTNKHGVRDNTFNQLPLSNTAIETIKVLKNDDVILGGSFSSLFPQNTPKPIYHLAKNGSIVDSLMSVTDGDLKEIVVKNDSILILAGAFKKAANYSHLGLAKVKLNGKTLNNNTIFNADDFSYVSSASIVNDTVLLVAGKFTSIQNTSNFSGIAMFSLSFLNLIPKIESVAHPDSIPSDSSLTIKVSDVVVQDYDNIFPNDFSLILVSGSNYSIINNKVVPSSNFIGTLTIPIKVSDGIDVSNEFPISVKVYEKKITAIQDISIEKVVIYPNPSNSYLTINLNTSIATLIKISVINCFGQEMISKQLTTNDVIKLNVQDLKAGLYFIKVEYGNNKQLMQKFIKN